MSYPGQPGAPGGYPGQPPAPAGYPPQPAAAQPGYPQPPAPAPAQAPVIPSMDGAQPGNAGGRWLPDGGFVVDVTEAKVFNGFKGTKFIVEYTVAESTNPAVVPGGAYSWTRNFDTLQDKSRGMGLNDIWGWVCLLVEKLHPGSGADKITDATKKGELVAYACSGRAVGTRWFVNVWTAPNKTGPGSFTRVDWEAMNPGEPRGLVAAPQPAPAQAPPPPPAQGPPPAAGFPPTQPGYQAPPAQPAAPPQGFPPFPGAQGR